MRRYWNVKYLKNKLIKKTKLRYDKIYVQNYGFTINELKILKASKIKEGSIFHKSIYELQISYIKFYTNFVAFFFSFG